MQSLVALPCVHMYIHITAALTSISVGAFADFYIYDIDSVAILNYTRVELISLDGYTTTSNLNYSTYIFLVGELHSYSHYTIKGYSILMASG